MPAVLSLILRLSIGFYSLRRQVVQAVAYRRYHLVNFGFERKEAASNVVDSVVSETNRPLKEIVLIDKQLELVVKSAN